MITIIKCDLSDLPEVKKILDIEEEVVSKDGWTRPIPLTETQQEQILSMWKEGTPIRKIMIAMGLSQSRHKQVENLIYRRRGARKGKDIPKVESIKDMGESARKGRTSNPRSFESIIRNDMSYMSRVDRDILRLADAKVDYVSIADRVNREYGGHRTADTIAEIVKRYRG